MWPKILIDLKLRQQNGKLNKSGSSNFWLSSWGRGEWDHICMPANFPTCGLLAFLIFMVYVLRI
uniref:Transmembrane protein n=1 Tax=Rhizophora mucronata TaxID=61149 RepID=A0A2P2LDJ9_RHIMU